MTRDRFLELFKDSSYLKEVEKLRLESLSLNPVNTDPVEIHHIYLKSFEDGRVDSVDNLVKVTTVEHIYLHLLLVQCFETLGHVESISYKKAVASLNAMFQIQWKTLSSEEKENLYSKIPEIAKLRKKGIEAGRKLATNTMLQRYGTSTGPLNSKESFAKSKQTRIDRYGSPTACANTPEAIEKRIEASRKTHENRYGGMTFWLNTEEAKNKAIESRVQTYGCRQGALKFEESKRKAKKAYISKYGSKTAPLNTEEARKKAYQTCVKRFGGVCMQMQTPESIAKRVATSKDRCKRRMNVIRTPEFEEWYQENVNSFKKGLNRLKVVGRYLQEKKLDLMQF